MTFLEKQTDPTAPLHWRGNMQADYLYPNGVAGDKFFKHIMQNDSFLATKCDECGKVLFPPRLYCEDCFIEIPEENWMEVPAEGTVRLFTVAKLNAHGKKLPEPKIMAMIDIDKTDGALLGVIKSNDSERDFTGARVRANLRPKDAREGTLKDIVNWNLI
ncbi:MAG: Zn-ribbon domain-containing OB-fold protein [Promethearchaeota archaeon]|nr:MAG: Zn-ribbon domain-containing OB-fold protein [Candidatus Lokiarchaeota archaeon]